MSHLLRLSIMSLLLGAGLWLNSSPTRAVELVPNGSFEDLENPVWECDSNCTISLLNYFIFDRTLTTPDGYYYLYLFHDAGVYQDLTIPSDTSILSYWYQNEPDEDVPEDGLGYIDFLNPETQEVYVSESITQHSDTWVNRSIEIPTELVGQTIRLHVYNVTGVNRFDFFEFKSAADMRDELLDSYATVRLRVFSAKGQAVKGAAVFVKQGGERVEVLNLSNDETVKKVTTNKKGRTPKFLVLEELDEDEKIKLCVKKNSIQECVKVAPETGVQTNYDFTFSSKKVSSRSGLPG